MRLRIDETRWQSLTEELLSRRDVESAGLLLARPLDAVPEPVLVVEHAAVVPDAAYRVRRYDQIELDPVALNRLTRRARDEGLGIFTIHTHPMATEPWFSAADDWGDERLMPSLHVQVPDVPHGSLVLAASGGACGRAFDDANVPQPLTIQVVGRTVRRFAPASEERTAGAFDRQALALGEAGQAALRQARVGVVGLGGTGSVAAALLAHQGVGDLVLMDGDVLEDANRSRVIGALPTDVDRTKKAAIAARYAKALGLGSRTDVIERHLSGPEELRRLRACDVVLSCVDRHTPRALLNRLAYEARVPVVDMGTAFRVDADGRIIGESGRVVVVGPGRRCLACWGHIDPGALRIEALPPETCAGEIADGYVDGAEVAQPSVIAFNTMVAGAAVVEVLRLLTAFAGNEDPPQRLAFSFSDATVKRNRLPEGGGCRICG